MKQLVIIGASGHGKVVADIARQTGYENIRFLDDNRELTCCGCYPVVGKSCDYVDFDSDFLVAIGESGTRQRLQDQLEAAGKSIATLIHPNAVIGEDVSIDIGTVVMAGAVINPGARIGKGCIINTCSSVDHDCQIADFVHIAVGAHLAGLCKIGKSTWIGAGATIINCVEICTDVMVGAGAVVIRNIEKPGTYVGVPAKWMVGK